MAKAATETSEETAGKGPGLVVAIVICLVIGSAVGSGFGFYLAAPPAAAKASDAEKAGAEKETGKKGDAEASAMGRYPHDAIELPMEPVIVTIGSEPRTNVRLEFSIVVASGTPNEGTLKGEIREDVIAYLKGLGLGDLEGGRRFQLLREQLDDRARIRGRGVVLGILISGLVVQ